MTSTYILEILKNHSDEEHRLSNTEIQKLLESEYEQKVEYRTVGRHLDTLSKEKPNIKYSVRKRKNNSSTRHDWYLPREREELTDSELRLLIDGLLFSKHIPLKDGKTLLKKLERLGSDKLKSTVKHIQTMPNRCWLNDQLFFNIEKLGEAISQKRQVQFNYITGYSKDKKIRLRQTEDGRTKEYAVSPYQMVAVKGRYYLICTYQGREQLYHYRIDRIRNIKVLDEKATPERKISQLKKDIHEYVGEKIYMHIGESSRVTFRTKIGLTRDIADEFGLGDDVHIMGLNEEDIEVRVVVNENDMFYWALQYGEHIEVLRPKSLRVRLAKATKEIAERYNP